MIGLRLGLAGGLALGTLGVFWALPGFDFVRFDDHRYVVSNAGIAGGLSWESIRWAFTTFHCSNWHPATWISLAADVSRAGLDPGAFHATNLALHVANTLLVFALLARTTGSSWGSAAVAALFAWHPLHVEPVAWVAERKELLAALFGLAACHAWVGWTRRGGRARYAAVALCMALSLLAKPMWATSALETGAPAPLLGRLANALVTPVLYLAKTVWPAQLSVLYPHPYLPGGEPFAAWQLAAAAAVLAGLAWLAWRLRERSYVAAGLAWYAIALLPVIGVVQVGVQGMADRYTYVPLLGVFWALCFGAREAVARGRARAPWLGWAVPALFAAALAGLALRSVDQVGAWRDTTTLYQRSLAATPTSPSLHYNLANRLLEVGREAEALRHYDATRALHPGWALPPLNQAWLLATTEDPDLADPARAVALAREASERLGSDDANALDTLAAAHAAAGDYARAEQVARRAVALALAAGARGQALRFEARRRLYAAGRPYREARPDGASEPGSGP